VAGITLLQIDENDPLETTSPAARIALVSENTLRRKADNGLVPSIRTATGVRLFRRSDLIRLRDAKTRAGSGLRNDLG
jgi:DNA-binding transcriptional MerR regulator